MINVLVIEDEAPARRKLQRFIEDLDEEINILPYCETINDAVNFLQQNHQVHLILSDINLRDGSAFSIYKQVRNVPPIIFITAYNEYVLDAFETNGIGYLLKPYNAKQFKNAWDKFLRLRSLPADQSIILAKLGSLLDRKDAAVFKKRFSCTTGRGITFLQTDSIAYFLAEESVVFAIDSFNQKHLLSTDTLKDILQQLDPAQYYQINRSEIVNLQFIERLERYGKNSIAIKLKRIPVVLITSQSKTAAFRDWTQQ
jgi:DNA-binding LytR/AlgR family response regulator